MDRQRRWLLRHGAAGGAALMLANGAAAAQADDGRHDFDFLVGDWKVANRRLKARLVGSTEWIEFPGTCTMRLILGGLGNIDDNQIAAPAGAYRANSIRLFDPATRLWSIYWVDSRYPGPLASPVRGRFEGGKGQFFDEYVDQGRTIRTRYQWEVLGKDRCHWAQALSTDAGLSWETNWAMDFTRA
jgi:hypothetical protein